MTDTKHETGANPKLDEDLKRNPGIGQLKGSFMTGIRPRKSRARIRSRATRRTMPAVPDK
jgi:hypothetical protein